MMREIVAGTIKVSWQIDERGLGIEHIDRDLTREELAALYDRISELVTSAFHQRVSIWIDGEDKPPVEVILEANDSEIEIDDGPVNGMLPDLRDAVDEEEE